MRSKEEIREYVWHKMDEEGVGAFPFPLSGRIPNFVGSSKAASMAQELEIWKEADVIKANPDSPQRYLRWAALEEGKTIYMAVPRLKKKKCFVEINVTPDNAKKAASISGAFDYGRPVSPDQMQEIDLIVTGSVAVNKYGERIGKGEGYSDIELALLNHYNLISKTTPKLTTVHPLQVLEERFAISEHDILLDYLVLPANIIETECNRTSLPKLDWDLLSEEKIEKIPILKELEP